MSVVAVSFLPLARNLHVSLPDYLATIGPNLRRPPCPVNARPVSIFVGNALVNLRTKRSRAVHVGGTRCHAVAGALSVLSARTSTSPSLAVPRLKVRVRSGRTTGH